MDSLETALVKVEDLPQVKGRFLAFSAPLVVLLMNGREVSRQARFIDFDLLEKDVVYMLDALES
ncbi:hypothetical protein SAMN02745751_01312 [Dethiosulfatibacter aminovorans DSM 17477]|uniref:Uncharacterized protein n=1 Tax=Dethiosulfatibacter aminovorans DSM 17477 TaxID=1121476 RepID=A0A1M6F110_9FIRM|nr:hypothetical protein [Dethiosulfatibacter aminovorans]SHI91309.1 hypothetical protein SAMN02745751_01312 [Dethiosulfatibacter aminovorans DSM 17477]